MRIPLVRGDAGRMSLPPRTRELTSVVRAVGRLVLPQECAGCGRPDRVLCRRCTALFGEPQRCEELTQHLAGSDEDPSAALPTWALATYAGPVRHAVLAWKSGGRPDLAGPLTAVIERAASVVGQVECSTAAGPVLVVPAPSGAARRRSGRFVVGELADALGRGVGALTRESVAVVDPLRRRSGSGHLLGAAARSRDRSSAVRCRVRLPAGAVCLLVDDVVTTGATLAACRAALTDAGGVVVGAVALAVTAPPGAGVINLSAVSKETQRTLRSVD